MEPYLKLQGGHSLKAFRVLLLQPGEWGDPIHCQLIHTALGRASEYQALSYAWGSRGVSRLVMVNSTEVKVTINLYSALRHLRCKDTPLTLWVDALCINQDDLEERAHQVGIMRHIYTHATEVIVFLGDGKTHQISGGSTNLQPPLEVTFHNDSSDDEHIVGFTQRWTSNKSPRTVSNMDVFSLIAMQARGHEVPFYREVTNQLQTFKKLFEALRMMLLSPWWNRIWVFQEAIVARKLTVRYGGASCNWEMFVKAGVQYQESPVPPLPDTCTKVLSYFSRLVEDIETRPAAKNTPMDAQNTAAEMLALLRATTKRNASDDRDKVYALLGLVPTQTLMTPDYTLSTREIYIAINGQIIAQGKSLAPFHGDLGRKNRVDLPSWVPDWSAIVDDQELYRTKYTYLYNACWDSNIQYIASVSDLRLYASKHCPQLPDTFQRGDTTEEYHAKEVLKPNSSFPEVISSYLKKQLGLMQAETYEDLLRSLPAVPAALRHTLRYTPLKTTDRLEQFHLPSRFLSMVSHVIENPLLGLCSNEELQELCGKYILARRRMLTFGIASAEDNEKGKARALRAFVFGLKYEHGEWKRLQATDDSAVKQWFFSRLEYRFNVPDPLGLDTVMQVMARRRSLFVSRLGVGWGPLDTKQDDYIYILPGGKMPFVLRIKYNDGADRVYRLIGECVIQEAMDGERSVNMEGNAVILPMSSWTCCGFDTLGSKPPTRASTRARALDLTSKLTSHILIPFEWTYERLRFHTFETGLHLISLD